jgi:hypothetical protein
VHRVVTLLALLALVATAVASAQPSATRVSSSQLTKRFKAATGEKLVRNKQKSYAGHYVTYDLGVQTTTRRARWGTFAIYLVTGSDVEAEVTAKLADSRTGALGPRTSAGIYWEQGTTLYGESFWMAKKRYGQNVVLTWIGSKPVKRTDATWTRLHRALVRATK